MTLNDLDWLFHVKIRFRPAFLESERLNVKSNTTSAILPCSVHWTATCDHQKVSWPALLMITSGGSRHRTQQNRRGCVILRQSNALIQKMLAENGFWHEGASQGHSRLFILQSFAGQRAVEYRHTILLAVSPKFSKTYSQLNRWI